MPQFKYTVLLGAPIDRVQFPTVQVPALTGGADLEAWHPQIHHLPHGTVHIECTLLCISVYYYTGRIRVCSVHLQNQTNNLLHCIVE